MCGLIDFAAQINRIVKHLSHPVAGLSLLDVSQDRDERFRFPPPLLEVLVPWTRVKSWVTPET